MAALLAARVWPIRHTPSAEATPTPKTIRPGAAQYPLANSVENRWIIPFGAWVAFVSVKRNVLTFAEKCVTVVGMIEDFTAVSMKGGPCGVYALLRDGKVVYVGQSLNVFARVATHWNNLRRALRGKRVSSGTWQDVVVNFNEVRFKRCSEGDLDAEELKLIQRYIPQHNHLMKRPVNPLAGRIAGLPCIQALAELSDKRAQRPLHRRRVVT